ncbi:hypothetical protein BKA61DRAFT_222999 [Leptodontidium sp. MPI-SDFR-AT-0119]|nr:hypothetical protein BKA61DRAFT_222999 [Leptodontidium sp. MPI-SDFR-AT-0119]
MLCHAMPCHVSVEREMQYQDNQVPIPASLRFTGQQHNTAKTTGWPRLKKRSPREPFKVSLSYHLPDMKPFQAFPSLARFSLDLPMVHEPAMAFAATASRGHSHRIITHPIPDVGLLQPPPSHPEPPWRGLHGLGCTVLHNLPRSRSLGGDVCVVLPMLLLSIYLVDIVWCAITSWAKS